MKTLTSQKTNLHIVSQSPFANSAYDDCLQVITTNDALLLINDGVYAAYQAHNNHRHFVLQQDFEQRGLEAHKLATNVTLIDYDQFVSLCADYSFTQSWY